MTKTFEELEDKIDRLALLFDRHEMDHATANDMVDHRLAERILALEILLQGDVAAREIWTKAKEHGVTPNIPKPEDGALQAIDRSFGSMRDGLEKLSRQLSEQTQKLTFVHRLEKIFGPMLQEKDWVDGSQVASKTYADAAVERFARAIREEFAQAIMFSRVVLSAFPLDTADDERFAAGLEQTYGAKASKAQVIATSVAAKLQWTFEWARERARAEKIKKLRPSRLRLILNAIMGHASPAPEVRHDAGN